MRNELPKMRLIIQVRRTNFDHSLQQNVHDIPTQFPALSVLLNYPIGIQNENIVGRAASASFVHDAGAYCTRMAAASTASSAASQW